MDVNCAKKSIAKDTLLYIPAKVMEGAIGILTLSMYSLYFVPEAFGKYTMINITVTISSLFLTGWLIQSLFRYVNSFNTALKLRLFYSTAFRIWAIISAVVMAGGITSSLVASTESGNESGMFVFLGTIMFVAYSTVQIFFSLLGAIRRIKLNLILSILSASGKLILTTVLVKLHGAGVESIIISSIIIDSAVVLIIAVKLRLLSFIRPHMFSSRIFKKFLNYGFPLMGVSLTMSILALSDRYFIGYFSGTGSVGIYSANYAIASSVFTMILVGVMRGVYPMILKTWRSSNRAQTEELLSLAVRYYLLVSVPALVGLSVLSRAISWNFLDHTYLEGSYVIIWVSAGMFFLGLTEYSNKAWELTSNTRYVLRNSLISGLANVIANIIFIPLYGYYAAAVTTALSYLLYLALSLYGSRRILKWHLPPATYLRIFGSASVMGTVLLIIVLYGMPSRLMLFMLVLLGGVIYGASLYLTGEISAEAKQVSNIIKRKILHGGKI